MLKVSLALFLVPEQIGVAQSKYVILDEPLPPDHVTWHMQIANFAIKMAHSHAFIHNPATDQASIKFESLAWRC